MSGYQEFLASKAPKVRAHGLADIPPLNDALFPFQAEVAEFLLSAGRGAAFLDTGLGKTLIQLDWARAITEDTGKPALILAPLAVSAQTVREAAKFGIEARVVRDQSQVMQGINVANYERLHLFDCSAFSAVVLDESSILKSFTGKTKQTLIDGFSNTPYRLACTATPAPNDHMELGNHAEFLGLMRQNEMLSRWFVNDTAQASQKWRLKGHAVNDFWDWVASWARCISKPSDLGYSDEGFDLPALNLLRQDVAADITEATDGALFRMPDMSATSMHREKRLTIKSRAELAAEIVRAEPNEFWLVWCDTNYEADALVKAIPDALDIRGAMAPEEKERRLLAFVDGEARVLLTKPSIAGFGLNLQHCARVVFTGLSFSYEAFYQAVRRCWRFGQARPVDVHVILADTERAIWQTITRKRDDHAAMKTEMAAAMRRASKSAQSRVPYVADVPMKIPKWMAA